MIQHNMPRGLLVGVLAIVISIASTSIFAGPAAASLSDPVTIEAEFQAALRNIEVGREKLAIVALRKILATQPGLARVRLELARALFLAGQLREAKVQFLIVLSADEVPAPVKTNILRFIREIDAYQGFTSSFSISIVSPSAAARRYDSDTVILNIFGRQLPFQLQRPDAPSLALQLEGFVQQQRRLKTPVKGASTSIYLRGSGSILDAPGRSFDELNFDISPGLRFSWPRSTLAVEAKVSGFYEGGEFSEFRTGVGAGWQSRSMTGLSFSANAAANAVNNKLNDAEDGHLVYAKAGVVQALRGNGGIGLSFSVERKKAKRKDLNYTDFLIRAFRRIDLTNGIALEASMFANYFQQGGATPGFNAPRVEREYGADLTVEKTDLFIFSRYTPFVGLGLSRRNSTEAAFSYDEYRVKAGIRTAF